MEKKILSDKDVIDYANASRAVTLPNLIKKHGEEEGLRIWENYKQRQSETCSKEYFVETYGIKEGLLKWTNWNNIRNSNWKFLINGNYLSSSKIADEFFKLANVFRGNEIYTNCLETKEYIVDKKYSLDYYDATLNIVVEFYGDYWYGNPKKYKSDDFYEIGHISIPFSKIWKRDIKRQEYIENALSTKMFIVWEDDYKSDRYLFFENIVSQIQEYVKQRNVSYTPNKISKDEIIPFFEYTIIKEVLKYELQNRRYRCH